MNRLNGKVAAITGAALGLGRATAVRMAEEGASGAVLDVLEAEGALHPLGHIGEADDIAWRAVYLASDEAKFVTGAELVIDGGYTAR